MKNQREIEAFVRKTWKNNVLGKFVYRGMDCAQLKFPLDPKDNPFEPNRRVIISFFEIVDKILDSGIEFFIEEEHFGKKCLHNPRDLGKWSRRDINRQEIDFTSDYQSAIEYSDCWQGSQLKQNIRSISALLRRKRNDRALAFAITASDWDLIYDVSDWVNSPSTSNPIVIHMKRDVDLFNCSDSLLPLGSENQFVERIMNRIMQADEIERTSIMSILQDDMISFYCSICKPLTEKDVFRIERIERNA